MRKEVINRVLRTVPLKQRVSTRDVINLAEKEVNLGMEFFESLKDTEDVLPVTYTRGMRVVETLSEGDFSQKSQENRTGLIDFYV